MSDLPPRSISRCILAVIFIAAGVLHFVIPRFYLRIMPPYIAEDLHLTLVYVSGGFEILGGVGLLIPQLRTAAGIGLILLLLAVFPANVYHFQKFLQSEGWSVATIGWLIRLPLQIPLLWWVYRVSLSSSAR